MATKSETNFIGPKNHVVRRRSLSQCRIVPVTLLFNTYKRSVSTAWPDAIPRLVQLLCGSRSHGVSEMKSWLPGKKRGGARGGARGGSERKQLGEGKRTFA